MSTRNREFDLLLCYERTEADVVASLAGALSEGGLRIWLDAWDLVPGQRWEDAIDRAMTVAPAIAACIGPAGITPWMKRELSSVLSRQLDDEGPLLIPIILPGGDREDLPAPLASLQIIDLSSGFDTIALTRLAAAVLAVRERGDVVEEEEEAGDLLASTGDTAGAEQRYRRALELAEMRHGSNHPSIARLFLKLGLLLQAEGDLSAALAFMEGAMRLQVQSLGPEDQIVLACLEAMSETLLMIGDLDRAEDVQMRLLEVRRSMFGERDPQTLVALSNLAAVYWQSGRLDEAIGLQVGALEGWLQAEQLEGQTAVSAAANLAGMLQEQGQVDTAAALARRVLEIRRRQFGEDDRGTLVAMNNLARILYQRGDLEDAEGLQKEVLRRLTETLGSEHPDTLHSMTNLAATMRALGRQGVASELDASVAEYRAHEVFPLGWGTAANSKVPRQLYSQEIAEGWRG